MSADDFPELPAHAFAKADAAPDADFYAAPRFVTHIDDTAIAVLRHFYRERLPAGGTILDLMSSWVSHLPEEAAYGAVIGHGMNAEELAANPRLTRWWVQDLNAEPALPLADASLDGAAIAVSIQYLERPAAVLAEVKRALKPGAPLIVSFSNRCFPTKAVAVWRALDLGGCVQLVRLYFERAGFAESDVHLLANGAAGDPLIAVVGR